LETWEWIVLAVAVAALVVLVLAFASVRRRRTHLKDRFGPEYDRAVSSSGVSSAEKDLRAFEEEHDELRITPLSTAARDRHLEDWRQAEARFVSDPHEAARAAQRVVERALEESGYPLDADTERRAGLVAVEHPGVADRYRHGAAMIEQDGAENTENLRKAMVDFRAVLEELLQTAAPVA
jgi:hypothetical protein